MNPDFSPAEVAVYVRRGTIGRPSDYPSSILISMKSNQKPLRAA